MFWYMNHFDGHNLDRHAQACLAVTLIGVILSAFHTFVSLCSTDTDDETIAAVGVEVVDPAQTPSSYGALPPATAPIAIVAV